MARQIRILIVDDDPQVLGLFQRVVLKAGYAVQGTTKGQLALAMLEEEDFDLLVLDLEMPTPDGFDILKLTRPKRHRLKILVVSGYLDGALLPAARCLGAVSTMEKPVTPRRLLEKIQEALGKPN